MNDVGENDGNYAFYPSSSKRKPLGFEKIINVYGKAGTVITSRVDWFHSATPNINKNPRHLLRIALCKNFLILMIILRKEKKYLNITKVKMNFYHLYLVQIEDGTRVLK